MFCPQCGFGDLPDRALFCARCGVRLPNQASATTAKAAEPVSHPAPAPAISSNRWESVGLLFDIDQLGETEEQRSSYGQQARRIFLKHFEPGVVGRAELWHGDTQATLDGHERRWCIAVTARNPAGLAAFRATFAQLDVKGLALRVGRFCEHPKDLDFSTGAPQPIRKEPLPYWLSIADDGVFFLNKPLAEDVALCRIYGRRCRLPNNLEALLAKIHDGTFSAEAVATLRASEETTALFEAIDLDIPGVPATLLKYVERCRPGRDHGPGWDASGRLDDLVRWPAERILARPDREEIVSVLYRMGELYYDQEIYRGGVIYFGKLAECADKDTGRQLDALGWRALCLAGMGKVDEAKALAEQLLVQNPGLEVAKAALRKCA